MLLKVAFNTITLLIWQKHAIFVWDRPKHMQSYPLKLQVPLIFKLVQLIYVRSSTNIYHFVLIRQWVNLESDCCLRPNEQFIHIMARPSYMIMMSALY
jgi:hypothetical protein